MRILASQSSAIHSVGKN
uniref:Uncharacterized protein n=1 Tax=Rhizophora mucronata TaxID=61149 RepID=A0A2P2QUB6_RHIMU